jgi:hypothetical protein
VLHAPAVASFDEFAAIAIHTLMAFDTIDRDVVVPPQGCLGDKM